MHGKIKVIKRKYRRKEEIKRVKTQGKYKSNAGKIQGIYWGIQMGNIR